MSAGWIGLLIGCVFVVVFLLAVALGRAAACGDRQSRRAAEHGRVVVTQDFWPRSELERIRDEIEGRSRPFDQDEPQSVDEMLREGFAEMQRAWDEPPAGYGGA